MKTPNLFCILFLILFFLNYDLIFAQQLKELKLDDQLRNKCHAYLFYTSAIGTEDDKSRLEMLGKAIELNPKLAKAFYNRGCVFARIGQMSKAKSDFQEAIKLDENYIYAHYNLACMLCLESHFDEAVVSIEKAILKGYQKFDKLQSDPDFKEIKDKPSFVNLIAKYEKSTETNKLTNLQKIQMLKAEDKKLPIINAFNESDPQAIKISFFAMHEAVPELRILGLELANKLNHTETKFFLLLGLYDCNGNVNKAAGNILATYGKDVEDLMNWVLEGKSESPAPFVAMQILAKMGATKLITKITTYLASADTAIRVNAAECLLKLNAVSALPEIEAALKNLPKEDQFAYQESLNNVIKQLNLIKSASKP